MRARKGDISSEHIGPWALVRPLGFPCWARDCNQGVGIGQPPDHFETAKGY